MDRQDLKEGQEVYVKGRVIHTGNHLDIALDKGSFIDNAIVLHYEKPVVPEYIADFIAEQKKYGLTLSYSIDTSMSDGVAEWYWNNPELFARAWLDGYEVEKEKRYLVKVKGMGEDFNFLNFNTMLERWSLFDSKGDNDYRTHHTRKELENGGFLWVFDCPGIEVEEVE